MAEKDITRQHVIFSLGEQKYGIDVLDSREIITPDNLTSIPEAPSFIEGVIDLRDQILPIINLSKKLSLNIDLDLENSKVIIISVENELLGLMVKEVIEISDLNQKEISETPEITKKIDSNYIEGIANLNDELIIIIKTNNLLQNKELKEIKSIGV